MSRLCAVLSLAVALVAAPLDRASAQEPAPPVVQQDIFQALFPPELIMQHRRAIGLTDEQRDAISQLIQELQGRVVRLQWELLDEMQVKAVNTHSKTSFEESPTLFVEFHGTEASAREQVGLFEELAMGEGAVRFDWAGREEDRRRLWKARHDAYWAVRTTWPGHDVLATDVCVPISRLAECVLATQEDIRRNGIIAPIVGHVGDGNFHTSPVFETNNPEAKARIEGFLERLAERAIAMDGTCTGEHGVGQGKIKYLEPELGHGLEIMRQIKRALDPLGIMNPGKIIALEE